jgi:hypothetical protein
MSKTQIDPTIVAENVRLLDGILTEGTYTAYGVARVLNLILEKDGKAPVRPQMMYNYLRNGLIVPGEKIFGQALRVLTQAEVAVFIVKYALRNGVSLAPTQSDVNPDQLELDLDI